MNCCLVCCSVCNSAGKISSRVCISLSVPTMVTRTLYSFGRPAKTDSVTSEGSGLCPTASRLVASSLARATYSEIGSVGPFLRLLSSCLSRLGSSCLCPRLYRRWRHSVACWERVPWASFSRCPSFDSRACRWVRGSQSPSCYTERATWKCYLHNSAVPAQLLLTTWEGP